MKYARDDGHELAKAIANHSHYIETLAPILSEDTFTLREAGVTPGHDDRGQIIVLLQKFRERGLVERVERVWYNEDCDGSDRNGSTPVWRYRWCDGVQDAFRERRANSDTLPCDCRTHVPDSSDDPEGVISCKFCGREYDRERFRELIG